MDESSIERKKKNCYTNNKRSSFLNNFFLKYSYEQIFVDFGIYIFFFQVDIFFNDS